MSELHPLALIVEDDPAIVQLLATILRMQGYATAQATHGDAALAEIAARRPDLITLDLNLPGTDGATILRRLRSDPATADLPVIVVSACTSIAPGLAAAAQHVITKPFELSELVAAVQSVGAPAQPLALHVGG